LRERWCIEQLLRCKAHTALARAGDHLQHKNRIAAQFEEVVIAAHAFCFEHVFPYRGERFFRCALRRVARG
jgi:hypothetical protein